LLPERVVQTGKVLRNSIYVNNDIEQEAIIAMNICLLKRTYRPIIGGAKCIVAHPAHAAAPPPCSEVSEHYAYQRIVAYRRHISLDQAERLILTATNRMCAM